MFAFLIRLLLVARSRLKSRASLEAENIILRQQVIVLSRKAPSRVRLRNIDRLIFAWLYRSFPLILNAIIPECDHRSQARDRDPMASARLSGLLALEIPAMWCPPEDRPRDPRSHPADETRRQGPALYGLVILRHARRRLVSVSVTNNPTAEWIVGQVTDAFPWDEAPRHLIRDRAGAFGRAYTRRLGG